MCCILSGIHPFTHKCYHVFSFNSKLKILSLKLWTRIVSFEFETLNSKLCCILFHLLGPGKVTCEIVNCKMLIVNREMYNVKLITRCSSVDLVMNCELWIVFATYKVPFIESHPSYLHLLWIWTKALSPPKLCNSIFLNSKSCLNLSRFIADIFHAKVKVHLLPPSCNNIEKATKLQLSWGQCCSLKCTCKNCKKNSHHEATI